MAYSYRSDANVPAFDDSRPVVIFDGHCALCSGWVDFLMKRDGGEFRFLTAQSPLGEALYSHYGFKSGDYDTNILLADGNARTQSDGTLAMFERLGGGWRLMQAFRVIPRPLRDYAYDMIARNRFRFRKRRKTCRMPTAEEMKRFL